MIHSGSAIFPLQILLGPIYIERRRSGPLLKNQLLVKCWR
jgi:hypothetical protein